MAQLGRKRNVAGGRGFGKPVSVPTRNATRFIKTMRQAISRARRDEGKVYRFFEANLDSLNESLLDALPIVFSKMISDSQQNVQYVASTFANFGALICDFPLGSRALNMELSIISTMLSMRVFRRDINPECWAKAQNNLGNAYGRRIRANRSESIEKSIAAYQLSLQVRTRDTCPRDWAATLDNLGGVYAQRIQGNRAENIEKAVAAFNLALQVRTRDTRPEDWAMTQNNLGTVYGDRIKGDQAENLERAIAALKSALQIRTLKAYPEDWAVTQNTLGATYNNRIKGDRAENLERAIAALESALQIRTLEAYPEDWAVTQNNLGNAYSSRIKGDRAENLRKAIAAYNSALQVQTRQTYAEAWATIQHNLANAYTRVDEDRADRLDQAISIYQGVAQIFTRQSFPHRWAGNQSSLAKALIIRAWLTSSFEDLDSAVIILQNALEVLPTGSPEFVDSSYLLGSALSRRYERDQKTQDLKQALEAYKIALGAISPAHYSRHQLWQTLPTTQSILGSRMVRDGEWQEGLQLLLNSVSQLSAGDDALAHASALFETGRAHDALSDWDNARLYLGDALRLYEHLQDPLGAAKSRAELGSVLVS